MNKHRYRLVFSRRHGMHVAVNEHARGGGPAAGGQTLAVSMALLALALLPSIPLAQTRPPVVFASKLPVAQAPKFNLPQPFTTLMRDPARRGFETVVSGGGSVKGWTVSADGKTATFDQGDAERVLLNWQSFDIAAGYTVKFIQDGNAGKYVSALNRVWSTSPSVILGTLSADREVILVNSNGVYFGSGARVKAGKFVASTLSVSDKTFATGIRNVKDASAVFSGAGEDYQATDRNSAVSVEAGAQITTAAGGDVLLVAPRVVNQGRIETPGGQTVLAAGEKVYLMSSSDPMQRGLIVAVDAYKTDDGRTPDPELGIVENAAKGSYKTLGDTTVPDSTPDSTTGLVTRLNEIRAESGTVNLVGLTVRQNGRISATTAVKGANGAIYLQAAMAADTVVDSQSSGLDGPQVRGLVLEANSRARVSGVLGTVEIGSDSITSVQPDAGPATQLNPYAKPTALEQFNPSLIRIEGKTISVAGGAQVLAPAGKIDIRAAENAFTDPVFVSALGDVGVANSSRVVIAPGARLSAAGLQDVEVDGARFQGSQRLFRIELADAPVQRGGPLYRSQVYFDLRDASKVSTADVSGSVKNIGYTAREIATTGGELSIRTNGSIVVGQDATLDVSGGSVRYSAATIKNSLVSQGGRVVSFRALGAGTTADALLSATQQTLVPAYTEGLDGGSLVLSAHNLAVAGHLQGQVVVGERQRDGRSTAAAPAALKIGEGQGTRYALDTVRLSAGLPSALDTAMPGRFDLSLPLVEAGGFGRLTLRAANIEQPEGGKLSLGVGGQLNLVANTISLNGSFSAPGGALNIATDLSVQGAQGDIRLGASTRLDVAGLWTNDSAGATADAPPAPIQVGGGSVAVSARHSLLAEPGAVIDVSAGARLSAGGALTLGSAGSVALSTGTDVVRPSQMSLAGVSLRGFDFSKGGRLSLGVPQLTLTAGQAQGFALAPAFFSDSGFGSIAVDAFDGVRLSAGTHLAPVLLNWQFTEGYRGVASGALGTAVATAQAIDTRLAERKAVNLALAATRPLDASQLEASGASIVVERGASIALEPGGALSMSARRSIEVGASGGSAAQTSELSAPGGSITLALIGLRGGSVEQDPVGFVGSQAIWLGDGARLSVSGSTQLRRDSGAPSSVQFNPGGDVTPADERVVGTVLGGGKIALNASRGYVVVAPGARLALDGAAAALNYPGLSGAVTVAQPGGTLAITSAEGVVLEGQVSAQAPRDAAGRALADGGVLDLTLGVGGVLPAQDATRPYPGGPRQLLVGDHEGLLAASGASFGTDLNTALGNGTAYLNRSTLRDSGLSGLRLGAGDKIRFDANLSLQLPLGLSLNAPVIAAAPGAQVSAAAHWAQIGDQATSRAAVPVLDGGAKFDTSPAHDTRLALSAPTIEVYGNLALQGFSSVALDAGATRNGEIRFAAPNASFGDPGSQLRRLDFAGLLTLSAGQVYATSATDFSIQGLAPAAADDAPSRVVVRPAADGAPAAAPLSVFGSLTVNAADIDQGGVLRQPFGHIALNASESLRLGAGSVTSVSGQGASELYGQTVNLTSLLGPYDRASVGNKGVDLAAKAITAEAGARVDAAGGGKVLAWEFFPGVGGTRNHFDDSDLYAVLPDYATTQALALAADGSLLRRQQAAQELVVTLPGSGLAPGRYALLPARYAMLAGELPQGAFLVSRAADQGNSVLRSPIVRDDGSVVITGYVAAAGAGSPGTPGQRFVVEPASTFQARSEIRLTDYSDLLLGRAEARGQARPAVPLDAGRVSISVSGDGRSLWQAAIDLAAAGGRGGLLDVAAPNVALVDALAKTPEGALGIGAQQIENSGAGSVLLGGTRSQDVATVADAAPAWTLSNTGTDRVSVDLGSHKLSTEELLLVAKGKVELAAGTQISSGNHPTLGARTLASTGDGALVAVSANPLQIQRRSPTLGAGTLEVGAGSVLEGAQLALDATGPLRVDPTSRLLGQALTLSAGRIMLGDDGGTDAQVTRLTGPLLAALQAAPDLSLQAYRSIDFVGTQDWARRDASGAATAVKTRLLLDAPLLRGLADAGGSAAQVDIAAQEIVLRHSGSTATPAAAGGGGVLQLQALPPLRYGRTGGITLGPGQLELAFGSTLLRSSGDIVLSGSGFGHAQGDLTLSAARVTADSGSEQGLGAAGTLRLAKEAGSRSIGERVGQGALISLQGQRVLQQGTLDLPGGWLSIAATGSTADAAAIVFGAGSLTSTAGFALAGVDGSTAFGASGNISASAARGRIELLGTLDVSAGRRPDGSAGTGDAGTVTLSAAGAGGALELGGGASAASGQVLGRAGGAEGDLGGRLRVDVAQLPMADGLAAAAVAGGFTREFSLRVRDGDVTLGRGISAQRIALAADAGALTVAGADGGGVLLDARSAAGGVVQLAAGGDLTLGPGTRIEAGSSRRGANGGDVLLATGRGPVRIGATAVIDASGDDAADGRIVLRAPRGDDNRSVGVDTLNTANLRAGNVAIEAVKTYDGVSSLVASGPSDGGTLSFQTIRSDNNAFMASKSAVLGALGVGSAESASGRVSLRAGVEVTSPADLVLGDGWDFSARIGNTFVDQPGGESGFLTLRAAGNLLLQGSLSDGFTGTNVLGGGGTLNGNRQAWSYRLVAGADLTAANPLAVLGASRLAPDQGDLRVGGGLVLRTGAGSIEMAAGHDVVFENAVNDDGSQKPAVAYVAGRTMAGAADVLSTWFAPLSSKPILTEQGGRLEVLAGHDIVAPEASQLINNWLWRNAALSVRASEQGQYSSAGQLAWWTQFDRFGQTLGSFGGGNLQVEAGGNLVNVQALSSTAGWAEGRTAATATLHVINGGDLSVEAGGDILGGQFLVGRGTGRLRAGGTISAMPDSAALGAPALAMMDGGFRLAARKDVALSLAFNPTAVAAAADRASGSGDFYTWGSASGLDLVSNAGRIHLPQTPAEDLLQDALGLDGSERGATFQVIAPTLTALAASGDITGADPLVMFPSATGQLKLWSGGSISLNKLVMDDTPPGDPQGWPSIANPGTRAVNAIASGAGLVATKVEEVAGSTVALAGLHAADTEPVWIHAEQSLRIGVSSSTPSLMLPKPAVLYAGEDILALELRGQNLRPTDVTRITAARNYLAEQAGVVTLVGPGALEISAGRSIDLGASLGVRTTGNLRNPALAAEGASVRITAGAAGTLDLAALEKRYLSAPADGGSPRWTEYRQLLTATVREQLNAPGLSFDQALAAFKTFPAQAQAALGRRLLAAEFGAVYLGAAVPSAAQLESELRVAFESRKGDVLAAGEQARAAGQSLTLPGREVLRGDALTAYLNELRGLSFGSLDLGSTLAARVASREKVRQGWHALVAQGLGSDAETLDARLARGADDPLTQQYARQLADYSGRRFEAYSQRAMADEMVSAALAASNFGRKTLPMRMALFDQGFAVAELAGLGSAVSQPIWPAATPLLSHTGSLDMTQSAVVTERGGAISLLAPGGPINVGLKDQGNGGKVRGVIARGGGDVFGYARDDFQVNTERVLIVGKGDMNLWSSRGDIDSGRGANTAVGAPALVPRRSNDGVLFELPAPTSGSGLGILADLNGRREGNIGLFPAFGEILALDAFIRAPSVVLGSAVKGADNLISASVGGAVAVVAPPALSVTAPPNGSAENRPSDALAGTRGSDTRPRNSLLTVDLLGVGAASEDEACEERDPATRKCLRPSRPRDPAPTR